MTFYWWSHWFWITLLSSILCPIIIVHTYPSQEISLEYNQNSKPQQKPVTKLYQTTTTLTWVTTAPLGHNNKIVGMHAEKTTLQNVTPEGIETESEILRKLDAADKDLLDDHVEYAAHDADHFDVEDDEEETDGLEEEDDEMSDDAEEVEADYEFKRSAENYNNAQINKTGADMKESLAKMSAETASSPSQTAAEAKNNTQLQMATSDMNNYTNFSSSTSETNKNATTAVNSKSNSNATLLTNSAALATNTNSTNNAVSAAPSAPRIDNAATAGATAAVATHSAMDWFNAMAAQLPAAHVTVNDDSEPVTVPHKIPFTLENVNKEEELRRAENEHRSRKSKVLSAEYKHINRYINFSTDTKSLLTRSASTAPNEFDDDGDEGNISSEALAIQRTYFLDAGAISAICFTIFGICCTVGTIGILLYRRRYLNKPQALSEPDSSVYIDDSTMRVSDNSDEMYSLDNDSFLNSLEAMTIQNYWTDTVKHTKL